MLVKKHRKWQMSLNVYQIQVVLCLFVAFTLGARDFSSAVSSFCQVFIVTRGFGLRPKMCRPSANTENSHCTRQKPLVPKVRRFSIAIKISWKTYGIYIDLTLAKFEVKFQQKWTWQSSLSSQLSTTIVTDWEIINRGVHAHSYVMRNHGKMAGNSKICIGIQSRLILPEFIYLMLSPWKE